MIKGADVILNELICFFLAYGASIPLVSLYLPVAIFYLQRK